MIRNLKNDDIDIVMELWKNSTIEAQNFIPDSYWLENYDNVKNNYLPNSDTYVYEEDGEIKGFVSLIENIFIGGLFIRVDSQREGIGSVILDFLKERNDKLQLTVYDKNERAMKFYLKSGFKILNTEIDKKTREKEHLMEWRR
ncbi:MAG: N-acetyltransferase [Fusobacterium varium]|jgi:putative acetyltransferase|uniref:N-acetyltransferase n=1 Tax=Fusobacterium TaxID=848 RepID=UPI000E8EA080|nr:MULTISPECIES: N-acetyltransferase [Fusobacterium]UYI77427.1 MAG: N-acetyltransferase [Fusobacterium varium]HBJ79695.1 N-acetyltransferase [Fusobacterium sp.]